MSSPGQRGSRRTTLRCPWVGAAAIPDEGFKPRHSLLQSFRAWRSHPGLTLQNQDGSRRPPDPPCWALPPLRRPIWTSSVSAACRPSRDWGDTSRCSASWISRPGIQGSDPRDGPASPVYPIPRPRSPPICPAAPLPGFPPSWSALVPQAGLSGSLPSPARRPGRTGTPFARSSSSAGFSQQVLPQELSDPAGPDISLLSLPDLLLLLWIMLTQGTPLLGCLLQSGLGPRDPYHHVISCRGIQPVEHGQLKVPCSRWGGPFRLAKPSFSLAPLPIVRRPGSHYISRLSVPGAARVSPLSRPSMGGLIHRARAPSRGSLLRLRPLLRLLPFRFRC